MIKGKIVLVPFPFDDLSAAKVRPAAVLTEPVGSHRHVVLAFITSQIPNPLLDSDLEIAPNHADFQTTGLRTASALRLHRLLTAPTSLVQRELGELSLSLQTQVTEKLRRLFGL